jgi:hypothetical protein
MAVSLRSLVKRYNFIHKVDVYRRANNFDADGFLSQNPYEIYSSVSCLFQVTNGRKEMEYNESEQIFYDAFADVTYDADIMGTDRLVFNNLWYEVQFVQPGVIGVVSRVFLLRLDDNQNG